MELAGGQRICRQGERADAFYVILTGSILVYQDEKKSSRSRRLRPRDGARAPTAPATAEAAGSASLDALLGEEEEESDDGMSEEEEEDDEEDDDDDDDDDDKMGAPSDSPGSAVICDLQAVPDARRICVLNEGTRLATQQPLLLRGR